MKFAQTESSYLEERKSLRIFWIKKNMMLWISGSKQMFFTTQEIGRKMIFLQFLRNLNDIIRNEKDDISVHKKNNKIIFYLAWNTVFTDNFLEMEILSILRKKTKKYLYSALRLHVNQVGPCKIFMPNNPQKLLFFSKYFQKNCK